ncbi:MAG: HAD family phosphatase [Chloroflexi bacterium]|nr:HAD family phosphatase [Chloroflexota bacterium]
MTIHAVVFDIGGVLENTPDLGIIASWEQRLNLQPGQLNERLSPVWQGGSLGTLSEAEVHREIGRIMSMSEAEVNAFMADIWREYLGTLNGELADYFAGLRPRYQTAILSNSFVGAREKEQAAYGFEDMCDLIIYSHEVGLEKPDPRIFALTCERLGVQPAEVIFLDDVEGHVAAANEFGLSGILFHDTNQAIAAIEARLQR